MPYRLLAGVVPCPGGWLVASAKLVGVSVFAEKPAVFVKLTEILDHIPEFSIVALAAPVGLPDAPVRGGRTCERQARRLLGWPRRGAIAAAPCRRVLGAKDYIEARERNGGHLDVLSWRLLPKVAEVANEVQPYHQRTVYEAHPELSFYQLNDDQPLTYAKRSPPGQLERQVLIRARLQGADRLLGTLPRGTRQWHVTDAAAVMWTARRIAAKAVNRLPEDPEWNADGLRMEFVR
jgi:predicted RNase H-like nuclease